MNFSHQYVSNTVICVNMGRAGTYGSDSRSTILSRYICWLFYTGGDCIYV